MNTPAPSPSHRAVLLQHYLTSLREHADPALVPTSVARRRRPGLSQEQVARAIGVTPGYYGRLEAGDTPWRREWADALTHLYQLTAPQRTALYQLTLGWSPPQPPPPAPTDPARALIDAAPYPAMLLDPLTDIQYTNTHTLCASLRPGTNLTRTILLDPDLRPRLHDWPHTWALPALGRLRAASRRAPEPYQTRIDALLTELLQSPEIRTLWNQSRGHYPDPGSSALRHLVSDNGTHRTLRLISQLPDQHPHSRVLFTIPTNPPPDTTAPPTA